MPAVLPAKDDLQDFKRREIIASRISKPATISEATVTTKSASCVVLALTVTAKVDCSWLQTFAQFISYFISGFVLEVRALFWNICPFYDSLDCLVLTCRWRFIKKYTILDWMWPSCWYTDTFFPQLKIFKKLRCGS